jgi:ORF6N domain
MSATALASETAAVAQRIHTIRGQRVLLDADLAAVYGVTTKRLNEQVRRNTERFPQDFIFQLTNQEVRASRSQIATLNAGRGSNVKYLPFAFTEHGAVMAATVLNSPQAVQMSILIVRAFIELRAVQSANALLARKLNALEKSVVVLDADSKRQFKELRTLVFSLAMPPVKEQ